MLGALTTRSPRRTSMALSSHNVIPVVWELVQAIIATILGAWLYKEEGAVTAA